MLPARDAPAIGIVLALSVLSGAIALFRASGAHEPHGRDEAIVWLIACAALTALSGALYVATAHTDTRERDRTHRERACQATRNTSIFASMLLLLNAFAAVTFVIAVAWPTSESSLRNALAVHAANAPLLSVWYFASTVGFAPLPRLPAPK